MRGQTEQEKRLVCEARYWLRAGYINAAKVDELMPRIIAKRGIDAADTLREEMRQQWKHRHTWWEGAPL